VGIPHLTRLDSAMLSIGVTDAHAGTLGGAQVTFQMCNCSSIGVGGSRFSRSARVLIERPRNGVSRPGLFKQVVGAPVEITQHGILPQLAGKFDIIFRRDGLPAFGGIADA